MTLPLITKYRPSSFEEVLGNKACVSALADAVRSQSRPHFYLFLGSAGIGKTTLARIIGKEIDAFIEEIAGAIHSGVDDTKRIVELTQFKPVTGKPTRLIIIDECHALSKKAWDPLLKLTEDPPPWLYICLSTTEVGSVPDTIKTRAYTVPLKKLKMPEIQDLVQTVSELENWTVANDVFMGICLAADGSARQSLSFLQAGHAAKDKNELSEIIARVESENNPAIKLCNFLMKGGANWRAITQLLNEIEDEEAAIFDMSRYLAGAMVKSEEQQAKEIYRMLRSFTETNTWDKRIHFYTAIGKILWGQMPF